LFYWEDIQFNTEILNVPGFQYRSGDEYGTLKVLDEHTFQITFKEPHLFFHIMIANYLDFTSYPKHYLKQFHPKYIPTDELKKKAKKAGFDTWLQLWSAKSSSSGQGWFVGNPDRAMLFAYKVTQAAPERLVHTCNPYYWKVDSAGNQLPYIDEIVHTLTEDTTMLNLKAAAGEVDFQGRRLSPNNLPTFMVNAEKNNFDVALYDTHIGALPGIFINQTVEDLTLRKIFQDVRFRQALSVAINREEANELVTTGLLTPRHASSASNSIFHRDKWAKNYAQYDVKLANRLLDEMGLKWDGKYRLRPDGEKLTKFLAVEAPSFRAG
jgi:peptide/nickel transport system substrate-binding protein